MELHDHPACAPYYLISTGCFNAAGIERILHSQGMWLFHCSYVDDQGGAVLEAPPGGYIAHGLPRSLPIKAVFVVKKATVLLGPLRQFSNWRRMTHFLDTLKRYAGFGVPLDFLLAL